MWGSNFAALGLCAFCAHKHELGKACQVPVIHVHWNGREEAGTCGCCAGTKESK